MVSPYKAGNYHLNEKDPGKYFQRVGKSKIRENVNWCPGICLRWHGAEEWMGVCVGGGVLHHV